MEFTKKHFGTTASQVIITADNDLEAEGIELTLKYWFGIKSGYIKRSKNGIVTYTIYPTAATKALRGFDWDILQKSVKDYVNSPSKKDLGQGIATQI